MIADAHIYDRHVPIIDKLLEHPQYPAPKFILDPTVKDFYDFDRTSVQLENYQYTDLGEEIPVAI